jgi:dienelactone hydrolase
MANVVVVRADGRAGARDRGVLAPMLDEGRHKWIDVNVVPGDSAPGVIRDALAGIDDVDAPIAVVGVGAVADVAIKECSSDQRVVAVVVLAADVTTEAIELMTSWKEVPVFVIADAADRDTLTPALDLYQGSTHPDSDIEFVAELDVAGEQFGSRSESLASAVQSAVRWLDRVLGAVVERRDVVCTTDDGWEIHGSLTVPSHNGAPAPAAVLLHSGRSDRAVFSRLERLLARRGVASLSIDWRGRGRSQNRGTYFELSDVERAQGWRDARAAMTILAEHPGIDEERVAMVGVVHGAEHAVGASIDDPRVKMLALLTGYMPRDGREEAHLLGGSVDVLYVTCTGHGPVTSAMHELVRRSQPGRATFRVYPGGAIGYQLFDLDERLEEAVAVWVADGLAVDPASEMAGDQARGSGSGA